MESGRLRQEHGPYNAENPAQGGVFAHGCELSVEPIESCNSGLASAKTQPVLDRLPPHSD